MSGPTPPAPRDGPMSEPMTEAGRRFIRSYWPQKPTGRYTSSLRAYERDRDDILAIEREAVAQERARLRAAVEGLTAAPVYDAAFVSRAAVLRVLDPEAEGGTPEGETT